MYLREIALVTFSILSQLSVGAFIILGVVHFFVKRKAGVDQADRMSDRALWAIIVTLALGFLASLFHLSKPMNAYLSVLNVGSAWLSREILFGVIFFVLGSVFTVMQWKKIATPAARSFVASITALIGLAFVFSMTQIYQLRTVPAWNTLATPVSFFVTTFLLGTLAVGAAYVANYNHLRRKDADCSEVQCSLLHRTLRWLVIAAAVLLGIEFLVIPIYTAHLAASTGPAEATAVMMVDQFGIVFALRLLLVFIGAGVLGLFVYQSAAKERQDQVLGYLTYTAFALVLVGEVLGRFLFYATYTRIGI